jgi:hypothetical protein
LPANVQSGSFVRYSGLLSDAVDEGLAALGQLPKDAIYKALKTNFSMQKEDIPARFDEFSDILRDNIGPSAEPLLGFIIDRFCREIRIEFMPSIDLNESISRVHMIVKGHHAKGDRHDRVPREVPVMINGNTADGICDSPRLMRNQTNSPGTKGPIIIKTGSRGQSKRIQNCTTVSRRTKPNSTT